MLDMHSLARRHLPTSRPTSLPVKRVLKSTRHAMYNDCVPTANGLRLERRRGTAQN